MSQILKRFSALILTTILILSTTIVVPSVSSEANSYVEVYRLKSPSTGEYLYSTDTNEVNVLSSQFGWLNEGVEWNAPTSGTAVYRLNNPSGFHLYTMDQNEINNTKRAGFMPLIYTLGFPLSFLIFGDIGDKFGDNRYFAIKKPLKIKGFK